MSIVGTSIRTEIVAGITTFVTMAYITVVNPAILSKTGMPFSDVFPFQLSALLSSVFDR